MRENSCDTLNPNHLGKSPRSIWSLDIPKSSHVHESSSFTLYVKKRIVLILESVGAAERLLSWSWVISVHEAAVFVP